MLPTCRLPSPPDAARHLFVEVADRVADLDAACWDRLTARAGLLLSRRYLRAVEPVLPRGLIAGYAIVRRGAEPVAAVLVQRLELTADTVLGGDAALPPPLGRLRLRLLVCGNVMAWGWHGAAGDHGTSPAALWPAVEHALRAIDDTAGKGGRADLVAIKDLDADDPAAAALRAAGYRPLATEPDMVLALAAGWRSFDDYLAALTARYRAAGRRIVRQVAADGCRLVPIADLAGVAPELHALYLRCHRRAGVRLPPAPPGHLPALAAALGRRFRITALRRGERMVGFVTTLEEGPTAIGYHLGLDPAAARRVPIFPRLLQAAVADAIALGCRRLSLGRTALDAKARLGARPRPLVVWYRARSTAARLLAAALARRRPATAPPRHPFRRRAGGVR